MKKLSITGGTFLLVLLCCAFSQRAQAVSPPPDGRYPGRNTAEGENALFFLTTGRLQYSPSFNALLRNTTGGGNTATDFYALLFNSTGGDNTATGDEGALEQHQR